MNLPDAFRYVHYPIVNSNYWSFQLVIDVSELLFPKVYTCDFIQSLNSSMTSIIIPNWTCHDINYTVFDISRFTLLESIKLAMIVSNQYQHSKSTDWINWKLSKSARIHLLWKSMKLLITCQIHSTYWIVNHWNLFKLVNSVSRIMQANLNWRTYHNYNPFKLAQLERTHTISITVHLWFEVLNWYWIL